MKREIVKDKSFWESMIGKYAGEYIRIVKGRALVDMLDDGTGQPIARGAECYAVTLWLDGQEAPNWEPNFLDVETHDNKE